VARFSFPVSAGKALEDHGDEEPARECRAGEDLRMIVGQAALG
jgi:hypothetical protein